MRKKAVARSIAQLLLDMKDHPAMAHSRISVEQLTLCFHERGFGLMLLLFALPMALPLPVPPGINILLALPLVFLTAQQMVGRHTLWLPRWVLCQTLDTKSWLSLTDKMVPMLQKLEALTRPRLLYLTGNFTQKMTGLLGVIMALCVCVPLPLTNTVPSFGIAIMALGVLTRDGLFIVTGALIGMAWVSILIGAFLFFGSEAVDIIKQLIHSVL